MATYKRIDGNYVITTINSSDSIQLVSNEVDVSGNLTIAGNIVVGNVSIGNLTATNITGTLLTASQPYITSLGNLTSLIVLGTVQTGALTASSLTTSLVTAANLSGTLLTASQPNITSIGNLAQANIGNLTVTGTLNAGDITVSSIANGTSNVDIIGSSGNVTTTVNGNANILVVTGTGVNVAGTLNATGVANIGGNANVVGNFSVGGFYFGDGGFLSNVAANIGSATRVSNGLSQVDIAVANGNILFNVSTTANVMTVDQGGISVGGNATLSGALTMSAGNITTLGNVSAGYFLGNGALLSGIVTSVSNVVNGTSNLNIATANSNVTVSVGGVSNVLNVTTTGLEVIGNLSVTGNASLSGNILGDRVQNGTTSFDIQTPSGNANISVGGVSNVVVFTTTSAEFSGAVSVSGNLSTSTAAGNTNTTTVATTAFVVGQAGGATPGAVGSASIGTSLRYAREDHTHSGVTSVNGSTGAVTSIATTTGNLAQFASTTSAQLAGVISDETGSGSLVFATSPTLAGTPLAPNAAGNTNTAQIATTAYVIGQAGGATPGAVGSASIGTSSRYAREDHTHSGVTNITTSSGLSTNTNATGNVSITNTGVTSVNGSNGAITNIATTTGNLSQFASTTSAQLAGVISDETGSGLLVFATSPTLTTPNIGAATGTSLNISTGALTCGSIVNANANGVGNIGSSTTYFNTVFAQATSAQYADLAELYLADADYTPGTVVEFGGSQEITMCQESNSHRVAGVVSEKPAYIMNSGLVGDHVVKLALVGRVRCLVRGPVKSGDILVSDVNGWAQVNNNAAAGRILGKSLENSDQDGYVEIVVGKH